MCNGNGPCNHNNVALLSGPYVSAGAAVHRAGKFDQAMIVHAVRKNVKKNWLNESAINSSAETKPGVSFVRNRRMELVATQIKSVRCETSLPARY